MELFDDEDQENIHTYSSMMRRNPQQRKILYRNLLSRIEGIAEAEEVGLRTVTEVGEVLKEVNSLDTECSIEQRVDHADETFLDCLVISSASSILKKCINSVDVFTSTYDPSEFSQHLINKIKQESEDELVPRDLLKLLETARKIVPTVPECAYVYGAYDLNKLPQPKPRKERLKTVKEKLQKKEPEKVTTLNKEEEAMEEILNFHLKVLTNKYNENNEQPIRYYDYIIDTDDFANTIENMFYFSFLLRDGKAAIDLNSKGDPIIKPTSKKQLKKFREDRGKNAQIITQFSMELWSKFKKPGYLQQHRKNKDS